MGRGCTHLLAARAGRGHLQAARVAGRVVHEAVGAAHGAVVPWPAAAGRVTGGRQLQVALGQDAAGGRCGWWAEAGARWPRP